MRKKTLAALTLVLGILCVLAFPAEAAEAGYPDAQGHYAEEAIAAWSGYGVLKGYPDGSFQPNGTITRAELATVLDRVMGYQNKAENTYSDLPDGKWCAESILHLAAAGVLQGNPDGTMTPNAPITRQEAFTALARVLELGESEKAPGFADDGDIASWAKGYIAAMKEAEYVAGDKNGNLRPGDPITRAEVVTTLDRMAKFVNANGTYSESYDGNLIVNAQNVTLKDMTIGGDLIVADGTAEGDVYLDKVTVKGTIILRGCGENSFHILPGCNVKNIIVTKTTGGRIRLVNESGETIPMIYVNDGVGGVTLDGNSLGNVVVACDTQVTIAAGSVRTLSVADNAKVTVEKGSTVARVELGAAAKGASLTVKGKVTTLANDAGAVVDNKGTIGSDGNSSGGSSGGGGSSSGGGSGSSSVPGVISKVTLQLLAPKFGEIPDTADVMGVGYTAKTEWKNADGSPASYRWKESSGTADTFTANQAYQAIVTLTPNSGYSFAGKLQVEVTDGKDRPTLCTPDQVALSGKDRVVTLVYDKTEDKDPVSAVNIVAPPAVDLGGTAKLTVGYWNNLLVDPATFTYQWYACNDANAGGKRPIVGATGKEYTITAGETMSEGNLYYCCEVIVQGKAYPSSVKAVEVHNALDTSKIPEPTIGTEIVMEDNGRWMNVEIGNLMPHKDVGYVIYVRAGIQKWDGTELGGSVDSTFFDYQNIPESGTVNWRVDLADLVSEYIFIMMQAKKSYDVQLDQVTVTVCPQYKAAALEDKEKEKTFDMAGKGIFHVYTPINGIPDELWQGPTRGLQLVVRSNTGTFVDKNDPQNNPVPVGKYEQVKASFQMKGDWISEGMIGHRDPYWNGELFVPDMWLDGFETGNSMSHIMCEFYVNDPSVHWVDVYCMELTVGDIIFDSENS